MRVRLAVINGQWGLLRFVNGRLESAQSLDVADGRILRIHVQRNPDKLQALQAVLNARQGTDPAG
jgi:RNA polymerase sigma-70 factor (ECF subfamily)